MIRRTGKFLQVTKHAEAILLHGHMEQLSSLGDLMSQKYFSVQSSPLVTIPFITIYWI